MIDYIFAFANQAAAAADAVVGAYVGNPSLCISNLSVTKAGAAVDSNYRMLVGMPAQVPALDSHANLELSLDRDNQNIIFCTTDLNTWAGRRFQTFAGSDHFNLTLTTAPTFKNPWAVNSMWKAKPVNPVLGTTPIPTTGEFAEIAPDAYGAPAFMASASDPPMNVTVQWVADALTADVITIPHWPANVVPATGGDGHCEIYDPTTGLVHSFWVLYGSGTNWHASQYTCIKLVGSGWGTPSKPSGPRAAGISCLGGLMRKWEALGVHQLNHALLIAFGSPNAVANLPQFPATMQDTGSAQGYTAMTGPFHYGTLFMLPSSFDETTLSAPLARVIARTLKTYGGYFADQTAGGFNLYSEIGGLWQNAGTSWNGTVIVDLDTIMHNLRAVTSVGSWQDANGNTFVPKPWADMNLLSMRPPWVDVGGGPIQAGAFNTQTEMFEFPATTGADIHNVATLHPRDDTSVEPWRNWTDKQFYTSPTQGRSYTLTAYGTGTTISASIVVQHGNFAFPPLFGSNGLTPGQSQTFTMPTDAVNNILVEIHAIKTAGPAASIRLELIGN